MSHALPDVYSNLVMAKLRKELLLKDGIVFNNDYQGTAVAGAVKIPVRDTEVSAGNYDKATGATLGTGTTTYATMTIDKDKATNEIIDGYDAAAVPDGIVAERLDSAAYALQNSIDTDGATELIGNGTTLGFGLITKANIYDAIVDIRKAMSVANVPNDGRRYLLVTPDAYAMMLKDTDNFIRQGDISQELVASGAVGKYAGFVVYEWNDTTANLLCIAGHPKFATRANEWSVPVAINNLTNEYIGSSAVQGRMVYAHKVLRATAIQCAYAPTALIATAAAGGTTGKTIVTVTGNGTLALKYRVAPAVASLYGGSTASGYTSLTSGTTEITAADGVNIEVVSVAATTELVVGVGNVASVPKA
jgi:hypothetical protein